MITADANFLNMILLTPPPDDPACRNMKMSDNSSFQILAVLIVNRIDASFGDNRHDWRGKSEKVKKWKVKRQEQKGKSKKAKRKSEKLKRQKVKQ